MNLRRMLTGSARLAWVYLQIGIANELQYRANFLIQVLESFIALGVGLLGLWLVFNQVSSLNGWQPPQLLVVMGIYILMGGVVRAAIQPNMQRLMDDIRVGTLDFVLTKPADAQVLVSVREFRFWQLVDVVVGLIVIGSGLTRMRQAGLAQMSLAPFLAFAVTLVLGLILLYCFWMMLTSVAFWIVRADEMVNLFEGVYAAGRWPVTIYPGWLRYTLTFLIPVAFTVTIPAEALTGRLTVGAVLGAAALAGLMLALTRLVWRLGVKNYSGASA
jgi:ABC-2 type transport system permease protein